MVRFRIVTAALLIAAFAVSDGHAQKTQETRNMDIRHSTLDSLWYAVSGPAELRALVEGFMNQAKDASLPGTIIGLISPHAGYRYSGPVAGYAYRQVRGKHYDTVVVVAPNHADPRLRFSSVFTGRAYETPLGTVPVDKETAAAIAGFDTNDTVKASDLGHLSNGDGAEHSLEIQLPFLQAALGSFKLVPIVMGDQSEASCDALAKAIAAGVKGKNVLLVGSSDMSHFFTSDEARKLDDRVRKYIEAYDPAGLVTDRKVEDSRVCGAGPIAAVMMAARELGATKATVIHMANSGDVTGDTRSVVGYLAAALTAPAQTGKTTQSFPNAASKKSEPNVGVDLGITDVEKEVLRNVVRNTLDSSVRTGRVPAFDNLNGHLGEKWGAFVTLTKRGELRGCIGNFGGTKPLITTVAEMTREAALGDSRFPRVQPSELKDIQFEISVLTPLRRVKDINDIVVGRDGLMITRGMNRGVLLPQVPVEWGWDLKTFLEQTCRKAGLPTDAWKDKTTIIEAFSAEVFH